MFKNTLKKSPLPISLIITVITIVINTLKIEITSKEIQELSMFISFGISIFITAYQYQKQQKSDKTERKEVLVDIKKEILCIKESQVRLEKITKYSEFSENLNLEIRTKVKRLTSSTNPELRRNLRLAAKKSTHIISDMLKADFKGITHREIMDDFQEAENSVGNSINYNFLNINNIEEYKEELKLKQVNLFNSFAVKIEEVIKDFDNGNRKEPLRKAYLHFTEEIVTNALLVHSKYKIEK